MVKYFFMDNKIINIKIKGIDIFNFENSQILLLIEDYFSRNLQIPHYA